MSVSIEAGISRSSFRQRPRARVGLPLQRRVRNHWEDARVALQLDSVTISNERQLHI